MKTSLIIFGALVCSAAADPITLAWDGDSDPDVIGYHLYVGKTPGLWDAPILVKGLEYTLELPANVFYYAALTSVDTRGVESLQTPALAFHTGEAIRSAPKGFRVKGGLTAAIETSSDLREWRTLYAGLPLPATGPQAFFRTAISLTLR